MIPPIQLMTRKSITLLAIVVLASMSLLVQNTLAGPVVTERVSVSSEGIEGDDASITPSVSADGRYIAFASMASNLVAGDTNGHQDIFIHDWLNGRTERVSIGLQGAQPNGESAYPSISADGNFVAFSSKASNLVANDTNGYEDVFVYDRASGVTERISVSASGGQAFADSYEPVISGDGRYVAFVSQASNLVAGATDGVEEIYYLDRVEGTLRWISGPSDPGVEQFASSEIAMSPDGKWVAFSSSKTNLVPGDDNGYRDIFLWDRSTDSIERVSLTYLDEQASSLSYHPAVSADGRYVAFRSHADDLVLYDGNFSADIFIRDRQMGTTQRISVPIDGTEPMFEISDEPVMSADGRFVAFRSSFNNLVSNDTNGRDDIFVWDRQGSLTRVSVNNDNLQANSDSFAPAINADGSVVVFYSDAYNLDLMRADSNGLGDVFSHGEKPTPEPTSTPTDTPEPTPSATPTDIPEPTPTDTPEPTPTDTLEPTATNTVEPSPTDTEEPAPTTTAEPTEPDPSEPTPTEASWPSDYFNLTSMCKLDADTGQMRIRNLSTEIQPFTLFNLSNTYFLESEAAIGDTLVPVPWENSNDTFKLLIAGYQYTKAIGDNPLCNPEPTDTVEPTGTPEPTETPTPEPTDTPVETTWKLDFETDAHGTTLSAGTIIDDEWAAFGITVSTNNANEHPAMLFDSGDPTGYDWDLGSPNQDFGGPGRGSGGKAGQPGENSVALGNVLIITEDLDQDDPDDYHAGGTFIFEFADPVGIEALQLLDIDTNEANSKVLAFNTAGEKIGSFAMQTLGNNSVQWLMLDLQDVAKLAIKLQSSGALAAISFYGDQPTAGDPEPPPDPTGEPDPTPAPGPSDPPEVQLANELSLDEGERFEVSGSFIDIDSERWTATVDYGDGQGPQTLALSDGAFSVAGVYGDNGEYQLKVAVSDDSGAVGKAIMKVSVKNVDPEITSTSLHTLGRCEAAGEELSDGNSKVACGVGDWMVTKVGETTAFTFDLYDPGSDDLTVLWDFGSSATYFNNQSGPDPFPSPLGEYPYTTTHLAEVVFDKPGVKHVKVTVRDDDGGEDTIHMKVLVRNNRSCQMTLGQWISYFMQKNRDAELEAELKAHLSILSGFISSAFGEMDPAAINELEAFLLEDMDQSARARAEMLTAWLNFVHGAVDWDDVIKDADGKHDMTYAEILRRILTILLEDDPSPRELQEAINLARAINFSNNSGGSCSK